MQHFNSSFKDNLAYDAWQYHMVQLENVIDELGGDEPYTRSRVAKSFKENGLCYSDDDYEYVVTHKR